jgi:hypothetical protein
MKKETKASKIMKYIASHPRAKAKDIAKALKLSVNSVYQVTYLAKKESKLPSTTAPNAQMSLALFSDSPKKRGRPPLKTSPKNEKLIMTYDNVNHPAHYKTGGIETIDFIEAKSLNYNLGNVAKYITRAGVKDKAKHIEDLEKGAWYLAREISSLKKGK